MDLRWLRTAISANTLEWRAGKLALHHLSPLNRSLRTFAAMMVKDHGAARKRLLVLYKPPGNLLLRKHHRDILKLRQAARNGLFTEQYTRFAVKSHQDALKLYEQEIQNGRSTEVKKIAREQIKVVQKHMNHAHHM